MAVVEPGPVATTQRPGLAAFRDPFDAVRLITPLSDAGADYERAGEASDPFVPPE
jgi:hypothetical protein